MSDIQVACQADWREAPVRLRKESRSRQRTSPPSEETPFSKSQTLPPPSLTENLYQALARVPTRFGVADLRTSARHRSSRSSCWSGPNQVSVPPELQHFPGAEF